MRVSIVNPTVIHGNKVLNAHRRCPAAALTRPKCTCTLPRWQPRSRGASAWSVATRECLVSGASFDRDARVGCIRSTIRLIRDSRSPINSRDSAGRSSSYTSDRRRAVLLTFVVAVVVVLPRDDVEPAWTSRRCGWGLPHGVAARNDPAGDISPWRACAMTLLRSPRIKRGPVTRRLLLFSSLCLSSNSLRPSRRAAPRPLRDDRCEIGSVPEHTQTYTFVKEFVLLSTPRLSPASSRELWCCRCWQIGKLCSY